MAFTLTSPTFAEGAQLSDRYTCDGADASPPLAWAGVPAGTRSLALVFEDADVPGGTWTHWLLYGLHPDTPGLDEGMPPRGLLDHGARQGVNDFGGVGYGGPCEPSGTHRYVLTLYALDNDLDLPPEVGRDALIAAMQEHILDTARLTCTHTH